jgi:hypothetical protein
MWSQMVNIETVVSIVGAWWLPLVFEYLVFLRNISIWSQIRTNVELLWVQFAVYISFTATAWWEADWPIIELGLLDGLTGANLTVAILMPSVHGHEGKATPVVTNLYQLMSKDAGKLKRGRVWFLCKWGQSVGRSSRHHNIWYFAWYRSSWPLLALVSCSYILYRKGMSN